MVQRNYFMLSEGIKSDPYLYRLRHQRFPLSSLLSPLLSPLMAWYSLLAQFSLDYPKCLWLSSSSYLQ